MDHNIAMMENAPNFRIFNVSLLLFARFFFVAIWLCKFQ